MKIKQIAVTSCEATAADYVYALLDDGNIYYINANWADGKWEKLPILIDQVLTQNENLHSD